MKILYTDVQRIGEDSEKDLAIQFVDKDTLLRESDFVPSMCLSSGDDPLHLRRSFPDEEDGHLINASGPGGG